MSTRGRPATTTWAVIGGLLTAAYLASFVDNTAVVHEDAAILMRYAQHLGQGLGYVWNPGDLPVDGATDWLGTTLLGGLYAVGLPLEVAPRLLAGAAHVLTVVLVIVVSLVGTRAPLPVALISAAFVAVGPARAYIEAGFLTTVFALGVLAGWACIVFAAEGRRGPWPAAFAVTMFGTTLARPEGLAVTVLMVLAACLVLNRANACRFAMVTVTVFATLFVAFLVWRWRYFGRLLPLPFLKKGGGALHWDGLTYSLRGVVVLLGWVLPTLGLGLRPGQPFRWLAALALLLIGYSGMWVLLSADMNYYWRFQYALVPLVASTWSATCASSWPDLGAPVRSLSASMRRALAATMVLFVATGLVWQHRRFVPTSTKHGLKDAAELLRSHGSAGNVLVTTEAGLLPLYSEWRTVDAWGLNDPRVFEDGGIREAYLTESNPDVIVFHAYYTPISRPALPNNAWNMMVSVLHRFAACHGYRLAAVFAAGFGESHYFYVKANWPAASEFTRELRALRYSWLDVSAAAVELAALETYARACEPAQERLREDSAKEGTAHRDEQRPGGVALRAPAM